MARFARIVVRDCPPHVTARGNRREPVFFENGDHDAYRRLLAEQAEKARVEIWAYCFMPNHVHLIAVPRDEAGLARAIGEAHRRYTNTINARSGFRGHLFSLVVQSPGEPRGASRSRVSTRRCCDEEWLQWRARHATLNLSPDWGRSPCLDP
jgi:REP element-mobilizing transposase RayT